MYLEPWMLVVSVLAFVFCAYWNMKFGIYKGVEHTLETLIEQKIIEVKNNKFIPYRGKFYEK